jgi:hypothetical protein
MRNKKTFAAVLLAFSLVLGFRLPLEPVQAQSQPEAYIASVSGQATTAAIILSIEPSATVGLRLQSWCITTSNATAAAAVTVTVQRRTTAASSGGTALTAEGTGTTAVSKLNPSSASFPGIARLGGTPGTAGAVFDQISFAVGEVAAGAADPFGPSPVCVAYGGVGQLPMPSIAPGATNGISINISAAGAGGLASGSIRAVVLLGQ